MSPDATRQEEFSGLMVDVLNKGALALLVSVGHQTGLFDTMSTLPRPRAPTSPRRHGSTSGTCANGWAAWSSAAS